MIKLKADSVYAVTGTLLLYMFAISNLFYIPYLRAAVFSCYLIAIVIKSSYIKSIDAMKFIGFRNKVIIITNIALFIMAIFSILLSYIDLSDIVTYLYITIITMIFVLNISARIHSWVK